MPAAAFRLTVRTGPNPGMAFDLTKEVTTLGRDVTNDIMVSDAEISRQHARLTYTPSGYVLEDLGSTNGTFVNGDRLAAPRVLKPGDMVGFGENVTLAYDAIGPEAAATVMGPAAARPAARPWPAQAQRPAMPPPVTPPPAQAAYVGAPAAQAPEKSGGALRWIVAGCGCLVLLAACGATLYWMPSSWWCVLLTPLKILGFQAGC